MSSMKINVNTEILELRVSSIKEFEENPRDIKSEAFNGLRKSLESFGYIDLLVVNKRNMILVSGHQRLKVLRESGIEQIPCIVVDVDEVQHQAMCLSLNNQQIMGYFTEALTPILEGLRENVPEKYLDLRLKELRNQYDEFEIEKNGKTLSDDIPESPGETMTQPGDLWILGEHRLLCGDSTNVDDIAKLMDGKKANLFATDPPYLIDYTGKDRPNGGKDWSEKFKEYEIKDGYAFMRDFLEAGFEFCHDNVAIYLWHAHSRIDMIHQVLKDLDVLIHQQIIWVKPCSVLTYSIYPWKHEPCLFCWKKGKKPFFRPSRKRIGTVWEISLLRTGDVSDPDHYSDIWHLDWEGHKRNPGIDHPTVKPTEVFAIPMRVHTNPGEICFEPFVGSGSQIIAGERLNRRVFGMELEPHFVDVAVKRWENFTGQKAVRQ